MRKKILCLDFDGVLHSYASGWKGAREIPDAPVPGAMRFLLEAVKSFDVAVFSSRSRYFGGRRAIKRWLRRSLAEYAWAHPPLRAEICSSSFTAADQEDDLRHWAGGIIDRLSFPRWKPPAHLTIDDRAMQFRGWWPGLQEIAEFKPWRVSGPVPRVFFNGVEVPGVTAVRIDPAKMPSSGRPDLK